MKFLCGFPFVLSMLIGLTLSPDAGAQDLASLLGGSTEGSFIQDTAAGSNAIIIADDDLTHGTATGFDLKDAPSGLTPNGPQGSASFQWGKTVGWVNLALTLSFSQPLGLDPITVVFGSLLINPVNSKNPVASADIVSPGDHCFLELGFRVDQETLDDTLSTPTQFRVFEVAAGVLTCSAASPP